MPAWLIPAALGILGTAGQMFTNKANQKEADRNRDWQKMMSDTSAQRSVADYRAAGLNPALAYDRGASSPGGASATIGNAIEKGVSSASGAAQLRQQLKQAAEQHDENIRLTRAQSNKTQQEYVKTIHDTDAAITNKRLLEQQLEFNRINQPADTRLRAAEAMLRELAIPGQRNTADFERMIGVGRPGMASAKTFMELLKLMRR